MFGSILGGTPPELALGIDVPYTPHELGQINDYTAGMTPLPDWNPPPVRVPPPFPLSAYLVLKRAE